MQLADYRKKHLDNPNPLIVRFNLTTSQGNINLYVGLFVSGLKDYSFKKKTGGIVEPRDFLHSNNFKIIINSGFKGFVEKDELDFSNSSGELKEILDLDNRGQKSKIIGTLIAAITDPFVAKLEQEARAKIQEKEAEYFEKLLQYTSITVMHKVPSFIPIDLQDQSETKRKGVFPITLPTIESYLKRRNPDKPIGPDKHFMDVVERIFSWNLRGLGNPNRISLSSSYYRFFSHLQAEPQFTRQCSNLFGRNPMDGDGKDGCFDSAFDYYFADSEQAFLEWLDAIETEIIIEPGILRSGIDQFPYNVFELTDLAGRQDQTGIPFSKWLSDKNVAAVPIDEVAKKEHSEHPLPKPLAVSKIKLEFLSYLDMCRSCRGTLSYLMGKIDNNGKSWIQKRVEKFIFAWFEHKKESIDIENNVSLEISCSSIAKCNKGENS
jgi:hypothetical protein